MRQRGRSGEGGAAVFIDVSPAPRVPVAPLNEKPTAPCRFAQADAASTATVARIYASVWQAVTKKRSRARSSGTAG
ncbi:hypothetical protein [Nocardia sp. MW-W600-9]